MNKTEEKQTTGRALIRSNSKKDDKKTINTETSFDEFIEGEVGEVDEPVVDEKTQSITSIKIDKVDKLYIDNLFLNKELLQSQMDLLTLKMNQLNENIQTVVHQLTVRYNVPDNWSFNVAEGIFVKSQNS